MFDDQTIELETSCKNSDDRINEYILGKQLGKGSFGITYLATNKNKNGYFVVKILSIKNQKDSHSFGVDLKEIYSEIAILKRISDNNCRKDLLCYREHFIDCSNPSDIKMIIVTDAFTDAITLSSFIKRNILDVSERLDDQLEDLLDKRDLIEEKIEDVKDELDNLDESDVEKENGLEKFLTSLEQSIKKLDVQIIKKRDQIEQNTGFIPLSHKTLIQIMHNILKAMYNLHRLGIGHGDIKPENILINENTLEIQLIDFGLSCTKDCKTVGTILYDSPEILENILHQKEKTFPVNRIQSSDIFSLGVVFYRLANGSYPFPKDINDSINKREDMRAIYGLINFYKMSPNNIFSLYNENRYEIDIKINDFIQKFFEMEEKRSSAKKFLIDIEDIIDYYNSRVSDKKIIKKVPTIFTDENQDIFETSPIKYTPGVKTPLF
jgi:serine/threonine protein kinase